ncbi:DNA polymerase alpha subunit B [Ananas comosus]|uniref:DNA polymerase alpha subunit B n=1 Tax=Ananas comosus TaxID=4615 RepID=A0A6P5GPF7_ANACO|nr:DNA polymerase alpha subunit B [Ananas comosus]
MEEAIKAEFEKSGFSIDQDDHILDRLLTYCINYKLTPSDLVSNWEIYYLNRQLNGLKLENSHMDGFLSHLQNEVKEKLIKEEPHLHIYSSNDVEMLLNSEPDDREESFLDTPSKYERPYVENSASTPRANEKPSSSKESKANSTRITPFGQRINKFTSQFVFNAHNMVDGSSRQEVEDIEDDLIRRVQPGPRCSLQVHLSQPEPGCRFMYDRIEDRFNSLENRIRKFSNLFAASGLYGELADATLASQKNIFAVGLIICDGEGHLNEKSILLQGSVEHSGGQRVRLDLSNLTHFSLFPGQVIGIEGNNPSGHCLIASKVVDYLTSSSDADLPPAKKPAVNQEARLSSSSESKVLSVVIAAGPFTTNDNLLFEPLQELLAYARRKQPQLLILMGPFVDSDHPDIKKGTADQSFGDIFHLEILRRLQDYNEYMGPGVRVILVPSIRDANHDFVFPQPAFDINLPEDSTQQITCVANPSLFSSNEVMFSCCTVDILKQLSSEEISHNPPDMQSADRMGRLATHLLRQRSYYPLYPPAVGVPLDFSLAPEALEILPSPDVLLLPSDLAPFIKLLSVREGNEEEKRCMCVNPGRLAKGIGGGTFVELYYCEDVDNTNASIIRI